jgi:hypothetical protein
MRRSFHDLAPLTARCAPSSIGPDRALLIRLSLEHDGIDSPKPVALYGISAFAAPKEMRALPQQELGAFQ